MEEKDVSLEDFYQSLLDEGRKVIKMNGYELIYCGDVETRTLGNGFSRIIYVSRHKTVKNMIRVTVSSERGEDSVTVTTDHVCMVYNTDHFFENKAAKELRVGDLVSVYDRKSDSELVGEISKIDDTGKTEEWVYDIEVDDDGHCFYADNILVHNSQFISIRCITDFFRRQNNLPENLIDWSDEWKLKLWKYVEDFVENDLNPYVQNLVKEKYRSENPGVLRYSLEYIADTGIYESKKHYGVRKIVSEGPEVVDKIKYSGIELKKGNVPPMVKEILGDIYGGVLTKRWKSDDFRKYLSAAYEKFIRLGVDEIAFWKGYGTERESTGFLEMMKGTTGIAKACTFYNQIIDKMGLGKLYDHILVGDKVRFLYVKPSNKFAINVLAYKPDQYPKEFGEIFQIDYDVMWEKLIINTLRNFLVATGFPNFDPRNMNMMEIDDL
jgi:hypothetical protein